MNIFIIIAVICLVGLVWLLPKKSVLKGSPARTWPEGRGKIGAKHKPSPPS